MFSSPNRSPGPPPGGMGGFFSNVDSGVHSTNTCHELGESGMPDSSPGHTGTDGSFKGSQDGTDDVGHTRPTGMGGTNSGTSITGMTNPYIGNHHEGGGSPPQGCPNCEAQRQARAAAMDVANALRNLGK